MAGSLPSVTHSLESIVDPDDLLDFERGIWAICQVLLDVEGLKLRIKHTLKSLHVGKGKW